MPVEIPAHVQHEDARKADQAALDAERSEKRKRPNPVVKYLREAHPIPVKKIKDKKLKTSIKKAEKRSRDSALKALQSEMLLTEEAGMLEAEGMERTWKFKQSQLRDHVDLNTSRKMFDLKLNDFGPYALNYTRNGKYMLIGGRKGHVASFAWNTGKLECEMHLNETVKDVTWLQNETLFAVAQKKYTYIYDKTGMELHCLKEHIEANKLDYLPYHFLLVSAGNAGFLKYQDVSTGNLVAEHRTKLGKCNAMVQNPFNAIMHLGHANGCVTMWSPSMSAPLVKMQCHQGPVLSLAVDSSGLYMATTGLDGRLKIWDIRTYKQLQNYFTTKPAASVSISQKSLLAVGSGPNLTVWKDAFRTKQSEPYMSHLFPGAPIHDMQFCPFEDIIGCGTLNGISSLVIPGSGEPNFDTMEANPYQTKKQRQESEVHALLDKIQPEMISLDPTFIGKIDRAPKEVIALEQRKEWEANHPTEKFVPRKRMRAKSSSMRRYLRKQSNVIDSRRIEVQEKIENDKKQREIQRRLENGETIPQPKKTALDRFK